jgi:DNA repair protein RadC
MPNMAYSGNRTFEELGNRLAREEPEERCAVTTPKDAADLVQYEMSALPRDHLWVIILEPQNWVISC